MKWFIPADRPFMEDLTRCPCGGVLVRFVGPYERHSWPLQEPDLPP